MVWINKIYQSEYQYFLHCIYASHQLTLLLIMHLLGKSEELSWELMAYGSLALSMSQLMSIFGGFTDPESWHYCYSPFLCLRWNSQTYFTYDGYEDAQLRADSDLLYKEQQQQQLFDFYSIKFVCSYYYSETTMGAAQWSYLFEGLGFGITDPNCRQQHLLVLATKTFLLTKMAVIGNSSW